MHLVGHNHVEKYYKRKHTPGVPKNFGLACVLTTPFALFRLPTNVWIMQLGVLWRTPMCTYEQCGLCIRRVHCLSRGVIIHKWVFCAGVSLLEGKNGGGWVSKKPHAPCLICCSYSKTCCSYSETSSACLSHMLFLL